MNTANRSSSVGGAASQAIRPLRFLDAANALTLSSLALAVTCMVFAMAGQLHWAVVALICSGFCDIFDGVVARRLTRDDQQKAFGHAMDSLVDACAFGMAPAVLLYASGFDSLYSLPLLLMLPICVVWRLALFSVVDMPTSNGRSTFCGLPCTYVALALPLVYVAALWFPAVLQPGLVGMTLGLVLAMGSTKQVRKPSMKAYAFFALLGVVAIGLLIWKGGVLL